MFNLLVTQVQRQFFGGRITFSTNGASAFGHLQAKKKETKNINDNNQCKNFDLNHMSYKKCTQNRLLT